MIKLQKLETETLPFVSVVICTYNRKELLEDCLNSIFSVDYPRSCYEVLIVDKGSTDGTEELVKKFPGVRFVTNMRYGVPYQRNKGAELARGSIVAYTDDDCIVDSQWLKNLVAGFRISDSVVAVGGPVYPFHPEVVPKKILVNAVFGLFNEGEKVKLTGGLITANSAFKREIFKTIKFDEKLGRAKPSRFKRFVLKSEDTLFCHLLNNAGHKIAYTPYAKVYHQIRKERIRVPYIVEHAINEGISQTRYYLIKKHSRIWAVRYSFGQLAQSLLRLTSDLSFTSCYNLIYATSTFFISITGLDKILLLNTVTC